MWSSWPWVRTIASTRSRFSRRYSKSGSTMSMPGISVWGNDSPASITSMRSSSSTTAMLRPTSPTPPRKERWAGPLPAGPSDEAGILEGSPDRLALLRGRRHERQARRPGGAAEELERRLDRDRVAGDEQRGEQRRELLVHLARSRHVPGREQLRHLPQARTDEVGRDGDHPDRPQRHREEHGRVVAAVDLEVRRRLRDQAGEPVEVPGGVLHADDVRDLREREKGGVFDAGSGPSGDVVGEDREIRRRRDPLEVGEDAPLRRLVVVRRDDQEAVRAGTFRRLRELERLLRGVGARAADDLSAALGRLHDRAEEVRLLEM